MAMKITWDGEGLRRQSGAPQRGKGRENFDSFFRINWKTNFDFNNLIEILVIFS